MTRFIFLLMAVSATFILSAQTTDTATLNAAKKYTAESAEMLKANNYPGALSVLAKAKNEVKKLVDEQLTASLPEKITGWTLEKQQVNSSMPMGGITQEGINTVNSYVKEAKSETKTDSSAAIKIDTSNKAMVPPAMGGMGSMGMGMGMNARINVTISNTNTWIKQTIEMTHKPDTSNTGGVPMPGETLKAIKVKDYLAISRVNTQVKTAEISIIVGNGTVQIMGVMVEDADAVSKIAEAINYEKIKAAFKE